MKLVKPARLVSKTILAAEKLNTGLKSAAHTLANSHVGLLGEFSL